MTDHTVIHQKAAIGADTTQIAQQNNYYGMSPQEASRLAVDLFYENFPKLQREAAALVRQRIEELTGRLAAALEAKKIADYSAFAKPDVQYTLYEAEKGYARRGTDELCAVLVSLVAERIEHDENSYLETVLDRAIELAVMLQSRDLDYLSLLFVYKHVRFGSVESMEDLEQCYHEINACLNLSPELQNSLPLLNMLGLTELRIGEAAEMLAKTYHLDEERIKAAFPTINGIIASDYGLSPAGIVLAIINAQCKTRFHFPIQTWIHA